MVALAWLPRSLNPSLASDTLTVHGTAVGLYMLAINHISQMNLCKLVQHITGHTSICIKVFLLSITFSLCSPVII